MIQILEKIKMTPFYDLVLPIYQRIELKRWVGRGKSPPSPHLIKKDLIRTYAKKYKTTVLIETGTYMGAMLSGLSKDFLKLYSIELDRKLSKRLKRKFNRTKNIFLFNGDSAEILPKILKELNEPAIFWLDAHYSKGITAKGNLSSPILSELQSIFKHKIKSHVILIDDVHSFIGEDGYPTTSQLKKLAQKSGKKVLIKYNVFILEPNLSFRDKISP